MLVWPRHHRASVLTFVSIYSSALDNKVRLSEAIIPLEAKKELTKIEKDTLEINKKVIEVAKSNEWLAHRVIGGIFFIGLLLSIYGAQRWRTRIQVRDDLLATLQIKKLRTEISKLQLETDLLRKPLSGQPEQQVGWD